MSLCFHTDTFITILMLYVSLMHQIICLLPLDIRADVCISTFSMIPVFFFQNVEIEFSEYHHDSLTLIFLVRLDEAILGKSVTGGFYSPTASEQWPGGFHEENCLENKNNKKKPPPVIWSYQAFDVPSITCYFCNKKLQHLLTILLCVTESRIHVNVISLSHILIQVV